MNPVDVVEHPLASGSSLQGDRRSLGSRPLRIVFVVTHSRLTGGAKVFFEYIRRVAQAGHAVLCISKSPPPTWFELDVPWLQIRHDELYSSYVARADVVVVMFWTDVLPSLHGGQKATVLLEQGDPTLFEPDKFPPNVMQWMERVYRAPIRIICVSDHLRRVLHARFRRDAEVVAPAIDRDVFFAKTSPGVLHDPIRVLAVGSRRLPFKHVDDIEAAVTILQDRGYRVEMYHVSQDPPDWPVRVARPVIRSYVRPPQNLLGSIYREADIYVCASEYESFSLPPLEAMASGTPVVSTDTGGIKTYASPDKDFKLAPSSSPNSLADAIEFIIKNSPYRNGLAENGLRIAERFNWNETVAQFIRSLRSFLNRPSPPVKRAYTPQLPSQTDQRRAILRASVELWRGQYHDWVGELLTNRDIDETDLVEAIHRLAQDLALRQQVEEAYRIMTCCTGLSSNIEDTWYNLAILCLHRGEFQEALEWANRLKSVQPDDPEVDRLLSDISGRRAARG